MSGYDELGYLKTKSVAQLKATSKKNGIRINRNLDYMTSNAGFRAANGDMEKRVQVSNAAAQIKADKVENQKIAQVLAQKEQPRPETTSPQYGYIRSGGRLSTLKSRGGRRNEKAVEYMSSMLGQTCIDKKDQDFASARLEDGYEQKVPRNRFWHQANRQGQSGLSTP